MYFDLENLIERFNKIMHKQLSVNEEGKHMVAMEDVIEYLQYLVDCDDYFDEDEEEEEEEEDEWLRTGKLHNLF